MILGNIGSTKMPKTIGTPPCTFRQPWVSVYDYEEQKQKQAEFYRLNVIQGPAVKKEQKKVLPGLFLSRTWHPDAPAQDNDPEAHLSPPHLDSG